MHLVLVQHIIKIDTLDSGRMLKTDVSISKGLIMTQSWVFPKRKKLGPTGTKLKGIN